MVLTAFGEVLLAVWGGVAVVGYVWCKRSTGHYVLVTLWPLFLASWLVAQCGVLAVKGCMAFIEVVKTGRISR